MPEHQLLTDLFSAYQGSASYRAALNVLSTIRKSGKAAYFVGGCVRDSLLSRQTGELTLKTTDFDIATDATIGEVEGLFENVVRVGASFGVIRVVMDNFPIEVAELRSDGEYSDGRHPNSTRRGTLWEDAARRDFTVNSLYYEPDSLKIYDFCEGRKDIENRVLRFIGKAEDRICEDHLRLLRMVRFACVLGLRPNEDALRAARMNAGLIEKISAERKAAELRKMLESPHRAACIKMMDSTGMLPFILPEVEKLKNVPQPPKHHPEGDVFIHTMLALEWLERDASFEVALATLLHDIGKPSTMKVLDRIRFSGHDAEGALMAGEVCARLKLPGKVTEKVVWLVGTHMKYMSLKEMRKGRALTFLTHPWARESLELYRADCLASHGKMGTYNYAMQLVEEMPTRPVSLIKGTDVLLLGIKPGPTVGRVIEAAYSRQLEGKYSTREDALADLPGILDEIRTGAEDGNKS